MDSQIENLLMQTRLDCTNRKTSSSSEDFLDSSDEPINPVNFLGSNADDNFISEATKVQTEKQQQPKPMAQDHADKLLKEAENARA